MRSPLRHAVAFVSTAASLFGCGSNAAPCMTVGGSSLLVGRAALLRLDVYGDNARCAGSRVADGAGAPLLSGNFQPGQSIELSVPSGHRVLVLSAFADAAGTDLLGSACVATDLAPGSPLCVDLTLVSPPDAAAPLDGAAPDASQADLAPTPCKSSSDCTFNRTCCNQQCVQPSSDPQNCGGCGVVCAGANVSSATCASSICAYTCQPGFGDCLAQPPNLDGCETPIHTLAHCGGCSPCDAVNSLGAQCTDHACTYAGCAPNRVDCDKTPPNADGCECATPACCGTVCQSAHTTGFGGSFYDCNPLGTYDAAQAMAACAAHTGDATKCHDGGNSCIGNRKAVCSDGFTTCICWGYAGNVAGFAYDSNSKSCVCPSGNTNPWT